MRPQLSPMRLKDAKTHAWLIHCQEEKNRQEMSSVLIETVKQAARLKRYGPIHLFSGKVIDMTPIQGKLCFIPGKEYNLPPSLDE